MEVLIEDNNVDIRIPCRSSGWETVSGNNQKRDTSRWTIRSRSRRSEIGAMTRNGFARGNACKSQKLVG